MGAHQMPYAETHTGRFIYTERGRIESMNRDELIEWLEGRGFACYDDESTQLLRETALEDYDTL